MTQIDIQGALPLIECMIEGVNFTGNHSSVKVRISREWRFTSSNLKYGVARFLQKGLKFKI